MRVFWDTNLFIYLWERSSRSEEMRALTAFVQSGGHILATSTLTVGEILVHPARVGREDLVEHYRLAFHKLALIPFDTKAAVEFARLRAAHATLRPPDAIQLACALVGRCELFLTNDDRLAALAKPTGLDIRSLAEWYFAHAG